MSLVSRAWQGSWTALGRKLAAAALALALSTSCAAPAPLVVRGEAVTTGNAAYDEFFAAVRQVRSEAASAANDEQTSHAALVKALGLEAGSKRALAVEESGQRAKKLSEKGVFLHFEISPEAHILLARAKVDLGPDGEALLRSMEDAARTSQEMRKRFAAMAARAAELEKKRAELRGKAPADFREVPQARRDEVIVELDAAQGVLADALDKANLAAGSAARFVLDLAQAVETGAEEAASKSARGPGARKPALTLQPVPPASGGAVEPVVPPKPAAAAAKPAAAPAKPAAAPAKPAAAAAPAAPPKKKAKGGDDFEP